MDVSLLCADNDSYNEIKIETDKVGLYIVLKDDYGKYIKKNRNWKIMMDWGCFKPREGEFQELINIYGDPHRSDVRWPINIPE